MLGCVTASMCWGCAVSAYSLDVLAVRCLRVLGYVLGYAAKMLCCDVCWPWPPLAVLGCVLGYGL